MLRIYFHTQGRKTNSDHLPPLIRSQNHVEMNQNPVPIEVGLTPIYYEQECLKESLRGCVDTGAPKTVCGITAAKKLCSRISVNFRLYLSGKTFKFADQLCKSLGTILIPLYTPIGIRSLHVEVVNTNIPLLLGLDFMDEMKVTANTLTNRLESKDGWSLPLIRHDGHIYLEWEQLQTTMFSTIELRKLHRQFFHPSADKLYNLIKRARPDQANEETRKTLQDITATCHPCQMMSRKPITFTVGSAKDPDITFNREVAMDIVYLSGRPALHIIDIDTHFHAATFLMSLTTDDVWDAICHELPGLPESSGSCIPVATSVLTSIDGTMSPSCMSVATSVLTSIDGTMSPSCIPVATSVLTSIDGTMSQTYVIDFSDTPRTRMPCVTSIVSSANGRCEHRFSI